jgi:hypothetical protein
MVVLEGMTTLFPADIVAVSLDELGQLLPVPPVHDEPLFQLQLL